MLSAILLLSLTAAVSVSASPSLLSNAQLSQLRQRSITNDTSAISGASYDYVIVGGGLGGLVTAARLSEDSSVTVLVIEAGDNGDTVRDQIDIPAMAYYNGVATPGSPHDWNIYTDLEPQLGNRSVYWPRAKVLGGCTAVNGLYMTRGTTLEQDLWSDIIGGDSAWNWKNFLPYLKRYENFSKPSDATAESLGIQVDSNSHGYDGPIHDSFAQYEYPQSSKWEPTWNALGYSKIDSFTGTNVGGFITPNTIDPSTNKRSYAKSAYLDPAVDRSNLVVLTDNTAVKILFDNVGNSDGSNPKATGVTFQPTTGNATSPSHDVTASKELILSAGCVGTIKLLQLSGVGPASLLNTLNIPIVKNLSGVGAHITDHLAISIGFNSTATLGGQLQYNTTYQAEQLALYKNGQWNQSLYSTPNNGVGWVNITTLFGDDASNFITAVQNNASLITAENYPNSTSEVLAGINATYSSDAYKIFPANAGVTEVLMGNTGQSFQLQLSHQHPFSRGTVHIKSTNPYDTPTVKANYLSHPADVMIMRQGIKFMRLLASTAPLSDIIQAETFPGANITEDADIEAYIRSQAQSQYHPAGGAAMMPEAFGGVVDPELKVYGIDNLRIIDASVVGQPLALHHMAPLYALAEKGSDLIRGFTASNSPNKTPSESNSAGSKIQCSVALMSLTIMTLLLL